MKENRRAMVMASFAGDSLGLGVHWIYDPVRIEKEFGRVESLLKPKADSYHPTKERGEFTHYGDQAFALLESLAARKGFDLDDFSERWRSLFKDYQRYFDQATKATLGNFALGKGPAESGSLSNDLAGAARIAPLVFSCHDDMDVLVRYARAQTAMTHNTPTVIDGAEFFAVVCARVLKGQDPVSTMEAVAGERFAGTPLAEWVGKGVRSRGDDSISTLTRFGQSCHDEEAFPGVVHLIARYETDLKEGLVQCVMAGGDSAGRAMIVGMVLGAHLGMAALPPEWISGMRTAKRIQDLLDLIS
ncbi:MAG: ADP-ribosylglycohydrolase family protein [Deltaproteobacteria bacterium]|nr:ADP-ribosylglycohydrolase family protein [Deltaproteobacteria bacterium]